MSEWLPGVVSAAALVVAAGVPLVGTLRSLKANKPVNEATADEKQAAANASSFSAQQGVINTLNAQLERQNVQLERQNAQISRQNDQLSSQEERIAALERKLNLTTARVEERDEQNELMAAHLRASQESLRVCRQSGQQMSEWIREHWASEHPGSEPPQVQFLGFNPEGRIR